MAVVVTAADRASFRRCRRQWDLGAAMRQDLEPARRPAKAGPDLDRAIRDALAVYYFPGMWDWDRGIRLPLVSQELDRALDRQRARARARTDAPDVWPQARDRGQALLARYLDWAPATDRFAPVLVETDFEVNILHPQDPQTALVASDGEPIRYTGRIDMMAVDQHDAYWIVRHRVVDGDWPATDDLIADEEARTACWAWEQFYLGMAITGIIYNELRPHHCGPAPGQRPNAAATQRSSTQRSSTQRSTGPGGDPAPQPRRRQSASTSPAAAAA